MEKKVKNKILSRLSFLVTALIFVLALTVTIISLTARAQNRQAEFFGYSFAVVVTDSMAPQIRAGDLIIVKSCEITDMEVGQNAVFVGLANSEFEGKNIVHRVVGIHDLFAESGEKTGICLETKGINNPFNDEDYVEASNFIGREIFHSTFLGTIMVFLKNPLNWLFVIVLLVAVSIGVKQGVKIIRLVREKHKTQEQDQIQEQEQEQIGEQTEERTQEETQEQDQIQDE